MTQQNSESKYKEPKYKGGGFTRREFFRNIGIAALATTILKFIPATLIPNAVNAEDTDCPDCQPPYWDSLPYCDCYCYTFAYYYCQIECGECVGYPGRASDKFASINVWANVLGYGCCWAFCYPDPNPHLIECESSSCPPCATI